MDWKEKIEKAMKDLSDACKENRDCSECCKCPFARYCDPILRAYDSFPQEWFDDEDWVNYDVQNLDLSYLLDR